MTPLPPPPVPAQMEVFTRLTVEDRQLEATIALASTDAAYRFTVRCTAKCGSFRDYAEDVAFTPVSIHVPSDADDLVYTTWGGGSAYRVKVYAVTAAGVRQVLDEGTVGVPDFLTDVAGRFVVRTTWRPEKARSNSPPRHTDWAWTGARFVCR